ncbi:MAG: hypothetical protein KBF96_09440 [Ignavibacteria bacterium]|nr:hypothetical protein [Ignavibacteria bacterium]
MKKSYIKYFTLFITIILLNSNFSFAISEMLCNMSEVQTECECETDSHTLAMMISSGENGCCKINTNEINNSNTLEKNNIKLIKEHSFQSVIYLLPVSEFTRTITSQVIFTTSNIPIPDIPIINSSFLI